MSVSLASRSSRAPAGRDAGTGARTPPRTPRGASTPRQFATEARAASRYMASPRIQELMQATASSAEVPTATPREGRRHFGSAEVPTATPREGRRHFGSAEVPTATPREGRRHFGSPVSPNPVSEGSPSLQVEFRPSRRMPYLQEQTEEERNDDATWKRIGIFEVTQASKPAQESPRKEAPHRSSCGFVAAQQMPTARELAKQSPRQQDREQRGLGAMAYFSNEPPLPSSVGVRRDYDSRNTVETDMCIFQPDDVKPNAHIPVEVALQRPWAIDGGDHSEIESPEKSSVQTARRNESSGPLEDGLTCGSLAEGRTAALALQRLGRTNSPAALAMEHRAPCWTTDPLPAKPVAKQITDDLPAYNAKESVQQLIHHYKEIASTSVGVLSDSQGALITAPYAMIDAPPIVDSPARLWKPAASANSPRLQMGGVGVSSLMSSGHAAAISSKLREQDERLALEDHSRRGDAVALRAVEEPSQDKLQLCDDSNVVLTTGQASPKDSMPLAAVHAQSVQYRLGGGSASSRFCLGRSSGNNRASVAWSGGLRGGQTITDKPWVSAGASQAWKVAPEVRKAIRYNSESSTSSVRSPRVALRAELQNDQFDAAVLERGCEERIQSLQDEIDAMHTRSDQLRKRIRDVRKEASLAALADGTTSSSIPTSFVPSSPTLTDSSPQAGRVGSRSSPKAFASSHSSDPELVVPAG